MDRNAGHLLAVPLSPGRTEPPKLRRKLQKNVGKYRVVEQPQQQQLYTPRASLDGASEKPQNRTQPETQSTRRPQLQPPDLSDAKWADYVRASRCAADLRPLSQARVSPVVEAPRAPSREAPRQVPRQTPKEQPREAPNPAKSPMIKETVVPEFSHLTVNDALRANATRSPSPRLAPHPSAALSSAMRRHHAKTPVFAIGQLEAAGLNRSRSTRGAGSPDSIEELAEQYRALLHPRHSTTADVGLVVTTPPRKDSTRLTGTPTQRPGSSDERLQRQPSIELAQGSPTSDAGTLVDFEEDVIYFKPVSYSDPPSPSLLSQSMPSSPLPLPLPDNLSLQICVDLLAKDLASVTAQRPGQSTPEARALQIWIMIEAYERLRDQLLSAETQAGASQPLVQMFDMWLRALYSVHASLNTEAASMGSRRSRSALGHREYVPTYA